MQAGRMDGGRKDRPAGRYVGRKYRPAGRYAGR